jgi:hypothetical protein
MQYISNGDWEAISKECENRSGELPTRELLLMLWMEITACYAKGDFNKADGLLKEYKANLHKDQDRAIFELIGLNSEAALKRARNDLEGLQGHLTETLSKAEQIEPGLVTATVYIFAATVTDLLNLEEPSNQFLHVDILSKQALQHLQCVRDFPTVLADKEQRVHIILATFYLGYNISGQCTKDNIDTSDINKAMTNLMAVHKSIYEGNPLSKYREVQLKLVQAIYDYRHSQVNPDKRVSLLRSAFDHAKDAERLSTKYNFKEMIEWSKKGQALCMENSRT